MTVLPPGWRRIAHHSVDSTNTLLKRMAAEGSADLHEGVVVTAETQTAGRGRQGRDWASPAGNLYASFLIAAPDNLPTAPEVGFVAAVSVIDAFAAPGRRLRCKWPNDVLAHGAKLCGILPELTGRWIVLGIGVNLRPVSVDSEYPVTSLAEHGLQLTPDAALAEISTALARRLTQWRSEGFAPIAAAWAAVGPVPGDEITVRLPGDAARIITGRFRGLDGEGALMVDTDAGVRRILAGDVLLASSQRQAGAV